MQAACVRGLGQPGAHLRPPSGPLTHRRATRHSTLWRPPRQASRTGRFARTKASVPRDAGRPHRCMCACLTVPSRIDLRTGSREHSGRLLYPGRGARACFLAQFGRFFRQWRWLVDGLLVICVPAGPVPQAQPVHEAKHNHGGPSVLPMGEPPPAPRLRSAAHPTGGKSTAPAGGGANAVAGARGVVPRSSVASICATVLSDESTGPAVLSPGVGIAARRLAMFTSPDAQCTVLCVPRACR